MGDLSTAFNLIVQACNDPNIGYSQDKRLTIQLGQSYKTYCDCSSLISWALTGAGFFEVNPWFSTGEEPSYLLRAGFTEMDPSVEWLPGDILWRPKTSSQSGHTEMVYEGGNGQGRTMGAHTSNALFVDQVSIKNNITTASYYSKLYRTEGGITPYVDVWYQSVGQEDLPSEQTRSNAIAIYHFFKRKGFTDQSIAGLLGNLNWESGSLNPNKWQGGTVGTGGYGLAQWTPSSKYRDWAAAEGIDLTDANQNGNGQCTYIDIGESVGEWLPSVTHPAYRYSWAEFSQLTDAHTAMYAFLWEYERAGAEKIQERLDLTDYWLGEIPSFPSDVGEDVIWWLPGIINNMHRRKLLY